MFELGHQFHLPILFWHSPFGYRRESFALGIVQGDDPGSVRGLFCHSERFLKGIFTPDDVGYGVVSTRRSLFAGSSFAM